MLNNQFLICHPSISPSFITSIISSESTPAGVCKIAPEIFQERPENGHTLLREHLEQAKSIDGISLICHEATDHDFIGHVRSFADAVSMSVTTIPQRCEVVAPRQLIISSGDIAYLQTIEKIRLYWRRQSWHITLPASYTYCLQDGGVDMIGLVCKLCSDYKIEHVTLLADKSIEDYKQALGNARHVCKRIKKHMSGVSFVESFGYTDCPDGFCFEPLYKFQKQAVAIPGTAMAAA